MSHEKKIAAQHREKYILIKALTYATPNVGVTLMTVPIATVLGGIYAKHYGLTLTPLPR